MYLIFSTLKRNCFFSIVAFVPSWHELRNSVALQTGSCGQKYSRTDISTPSLSWNLRPPKCCFSVLKALSPLVVLYFLPWCAGLTGRLVDHFGRHHFVTCCTPITPSPYTFIIWRWISTGEAYFALKSWITRQICSRSRLSTLVAICTSTDPMNIEFDDFCAVCTLVPLM